MGPLRSDPQVNTALPGERRLTRGESRSVTMPVAA